MKGEDLLKVLGKLAIFGAAGFIGYKLYKKYQEAEEMVNNTVEKVNLGAEEMIEFLKNKNQDLENKIKEKKENLNH